VLGEGGRQTLTPVQVFGNTLTCALVRLFWGVRTTDLGPFRAIRRTTYDALEMADPDFGWTIEMQVKAAQRGWRVQEVPVRCRPRRAGRSKVSGTWKGSFLAGKRILGYVLEAKARELLGARGRNRQAGRSETLVVFARFPEVGRTKTRLIPALGPQGAADFHRRLTEHAVGEARRLVRRRGVALEIHYEGGDSRRMRDWLGTDLCFRAQAAGDLGSRMQSSIAAALERADRAVIMGSDCTELTAEVLERAFTSLSRHELVLGPARDGGYYLIGLRGAVSELFAGPTWGSGSVLAQTLAIARARGLSVHLLVPLSDVDRPEDLREASRVLAGKPFRSGRVEGSRC
jgi:rSAM/selenodomain-associated transferase 1